MGKENIQLSQACGVEQCSPSCHIQRQENMLGRALPQEFWARVPLGVTRKTFWASPMQHKSVLGENIITSSCNSKDTEHKTETPHSTKAWSPH